MGKGGLADGVVWIVNPKVPGRARDCVAVGFLDGYQRLPSRPDRQWEGDGRMIV
jgi:hypothetical protein